MQNQTEVNKDKMSKSTSSKDAKQGTKKDMDKGQTKGGCGC